MQTVSSRHAVWTCQKRSPLESFGSTHCWSYAQERLMGLLNGLLIKVIKGAATLVTHGSFCCCRRCLPSAHRCTPPPLHISFADQELVVGARRGVLAHADMLFRSVRVDSRRGAARLRTTSGCTTTSLTSTVSTTRASPNLPLHRVMGRYKIHVPRLASDPVQTWLFCLH
jgi:hypothetical protein